MYKYEKTLINWGVIPAFIIMITLLIVVRHTDDSKNDKLQLLKTTVDLSSVSYNVEIKSYLIKHNTNTITFKALDSLKEVSNRKCDSILEKGFKEIY